ncbi:Transcription elongation factor GreA [Desulfovibrionales bacterium]
MCKIPISTEGYQRLKQDMEQLKGERHGVIQAIKEAREEGDLRENAGYEAARERQGMLEAKISYIKSRISQLQVIDLKDQGGTKIVFGATVEIKDVGSGQIKQYTLLGPDEANPTKGSISILSPVGRALLGKEMGDIVIVKIPRGKAQYEIISVRFENETIA